jgi:Ca2+-binding RTX toxin-like protein
MARYNGTTGDDSYHGTRTDDVIFGFDGNDRLSGGDGNDRIDAGLGSDLVDGGAGFDTLVVDFSSRPAGAQTYEVRSTAQGFEGDFRLADALVRFERIEALKVTLGTQDDLVRLDLAALGMGGAVAIDAGAGDDLLIADFGALQDLRLVPGANGLIGSDMRFAGFETYRFTLASGTNRVKGGAGYDGFISKGSVDTIDCGDGSDFYSTELSGGPISVLIDDFTLAISNGTRVRAVESVGLTLGAEADVVRIGRIDTAVVYAGEGDDRIRINDAGMAYAFGGAGDDTLIVHGSRSQVLGDAGHDRLVIDYRAFSVATDKGSRVAASDSGLSGDIVRTRGQATDFSGVEEVRAYLTRGNDTLVVDGSVPASAFVLRVDAGPGDDTLDLDLRLLAGVSLRMTGGGTLDLKDQSFTGFETLAITTGAGDNRVIAGRGDDVLSGDPGRDGMNGRDTFFGRGGDDQLFGGRGGDVLAGGNGRDVLDGGAGTDRLFGGKGADLFVFVADPSGVAVDTIADFSAVEGDRIDVSEALRDARFTFIGEAAFDGDPNVLRVEANGDGSFTLQGDVNSDRIADLVIRVVSDTLLQAGDIIL